MSGAWSLFARCDECGVDAGKACRNDDDVAKLMPCRGRPTMSSVVVRCFWCGIDLPLANRGINAVRPCCNNSICLRIRKRIERSPHLYPKKEG